MSSSLKHISLTVLRLTNINATRSIRTLSVTEKISTAVIFNSSKFESITTIRKYHKHSSFNLNNWREKQRYNITRTAVNDYSQLKSTKSFSNHKNMDSLPPGVFKGSLDRFNGVTVESSEEFNAEDNFTEKLEKSIAYWQQQKRRAIWFHVKTEHSEWVPHLTKMNFDFHHAKPGVVVLSLWLPKDESCGLPVYAHTMLGVGGLVVNEKNEVLVVSERYALIPNSWKLPGGYVEPRENIVDAAIREVLEETGIETVFNTVLSFRHSHGGCYNCSDVYFVVALTPKTLELRRCEREIAQTKWMPCEEYLHHPNVHETNRHFMKCYLNYKERHIRITCRLAQHQILKKEYCLYDVESSEDKDFKDLTNQ